MSTGLWSGVPLRTLLHKCGVRRVTNEAKFLHFAGPPKQAPGKGLDGSVGMCLPLAMCLDESSDILVALELNHSPLGPDQGAPLRMIVPGLVGNYSVKHLSSMSVAKQPSDNFFFLRETTRLPLHVPDAAQASKDKLWGNAEFRVTHAELNSVVSSPAHNDVLMLQEGGSMTLKGFAYAGKSAHLAFLLSVAHHNSRYTVPICLALTEEAMHSSMPGSLQGFAPGLRTTEEPCPPAQPRISHLSMGAPPGCRTAQHPYSLRATGGLSGDARRRGRGGGEGGGVARRRCHVV